MRKSAFLIAGIAIGVFLSKQIESNPETKKALDNATSKVKEFANAVSVGYRDQEAKAANASKKTKTSTSKSSPSTAKSAR